MSRKYVNDKWCVRCGRTTMTPFLRTSMPKIVKAIGRTSDVTVIDIGCGNCRNINNMNEFVKGRFVGYDMVADAQTHVELVKIKLGVDFIQEPWGSVDIVLADFIFMFLSEAELNNVIDSIKYIIKDSGVIVIELYPAKDSRVKTEAEITPFMEAIVARFNKDTVITRPGTWIYIRKCKGKCVLQFSKD